MFDLYAITDRKLIQRSLKEVVGEVAAAGGPRVAIQLREKDMTPREVHEVGKELLRICLPIFSFSVQFITPNPKLAWVNRSVSRQWRRRVPQARNLSWLSAV